MLQTIEAIIESSRTVRLLEVVHIATPKRALATLPDADAVRNNIPAPGDSVEIQKFLAENRLPEQSCFSTEEVDA